MFDYIQLAYYLLRPRTIIVRRISDGLGDNILLTVLFPFLREKYPDYKIIVETPWLELFENNPHVDWITGKHLKTTRRHIKPKYIVSSENSISFIRQILNYIDITEDAAPQIFLSQEEISWAENRIPSSAIIICPVGKTGFSANRKEWGIDKFQQLVKLLPEFKFVQIGLKNDPLLEDVIDYRDLSVRQSTALISLSKIFIGLEGGFMHIARAVNKRSVIIFGGYILPEISGYPENINIARQVECSPCYNSEQSQEICTTMICMKQIKPESVAEEVHNALQNQ